MNIDETNRRLIDILRTDARTPVSELSRTVCRSETAVRKRLESLESSGVIRGYAVTVDPQRIGYEVHAWITATCRERNTRTIRDQLAAVPAVGSAFMTIGAQPLVLELYARDLAALERVIQDRLVPLGLDDIEGRIITQTLIHERIPPVLETTQEPGHSQGASRARARNGDASGNGQSRAVTLLPG